MVSLMPMSNAILLFVLVSLILAGEKQSSAEIINVADFSGNESVETFSSESLGTHGTSLALGDLTFTTIDEWRIQNGGSFFSNIPNSSGSRTLNNSPSGNSADFSIDFSTPTNRIGLSLYASGVNPWSWDVTVFGDGLVELETSTFTQPLNTSIFVGFERPENIVRVQVEQFRFGGLAFTFIDDVRFESSSAVPEPSMVWLIGFVISIGMATKCFSCRARSNVEFNVGSD